MPPTDDKGRFVAIKLGLWKEGLDYGFGDIFPPDFLSPAGADLLLRTLYNKGFSWTVSSIGEYLLMWKPARGPNYFDEPHAKVPIREANLAEARLDAAYDLLKALEEK